MASRTLCDAFLDWSGDGERYSCERSDPHNGTSQMHAAMIGGEYRNWDERTPGAGWPTPVVPVEDAHETTCPYCEGARYDPTYRGAPAEDGGPDPCPQCGGKGVLSEPSPVTYMDLGEFRDEGFLQEANRQFFHPLGLALEWNSGWTEAGVRSWNERRWGPRPHDEEMESEFEGEVETLWRFITEVGLDKPRISGVWDDRSDPEGIAYGRKDDDGTWQPWDGFDVSEVREKYTNVEEERCRHTEARRALFGEDGTALSVQRLPGPPA